MQDGRPWGAATGFRHYDPMQLAFQVEEIVGRRSYLQHGVEVSGGDIVLDVGANVGVAAALFASCGARAVHSFEPIPRLFELLRENVAAFPVCTPHRMGLSSRVGETEMTYYPEAAAMSSAYADPSADARCVRRAMENLGLTDAEADERMPSFNSESIMCPTTTISRVVADLDLDRVDLLKLDVEKSEVDVLDGIEDVDWPRIHQIVAEVHGDERTERVDEILRNRGFECSWEADEAFVGTQVQMVFAVRG